jgi:hypothetical protein
MNSGNRNVHGILTRPRRDDSSGNQPLRQFKTAGSNVEQGYRQERVKPSARRRGISCAAFSDNKLRRHQIEFASPIPEKVSALLMSSFDNILAGASGQVADYRCFNVNPAFHDFSLGSENRGLLYFTHITGS